MYSISRKTAYKWIDRTRSWDAAVWRTCRDVLIVVLGKPTRVHCRGIGKDAKKHPYWGPKKLLDIMERRAPQVGASSVATAAHILAGKVWYVRGAAIGGRTPDVRRSGRGAE